ncbi:MAG: histidine phosphatase family protein [Oscillospiraceae bacterium]
MYIYLIRHGETEWNRQNRIQGRENIPLSESGREQARRCALALSKMRLSAVIASPLSRAVETAEFIAELTGAPIETDERLIERDFGSVSGRVVDIFNPEKYGDDLEPLEGVAERMIGALVKYAGRLDSDFAAVSHGGSINALLRRLSGGEIGSGKTRLKNACVNVLNYDGDSLTVMDYNLEPSEFAERYGGQAHEK